MTTVDRWGDEVDQFIDAFTKRTRDRPGDQEEAGQQLELFPVWCDPDCPDERLDAAYRSGIVPPWKRNKRPAQPAATEQADGTPLDAALRYASTRGWRIFPCRPGSKRPLTEHGFHDASNDPDLITGWWLKNPDALIGFSPGPSDIAVLDIDMKNGVDGLTTLSKLDTPILSATPTVITPSGGLHLHYLMAPKRIGITTGEKGRGIGPGLDWRGDGGYAILPSPSSRYCWGQWHYGNCTPKTVPAALMPREPERRPTPSKPVRPTTGLSAYAAAALDSIERMILGAGAGTQEATLVRQCFSLGTLASAGGIPEDFAVAVLHDIATRVPDLDPRRPWSSREIHQKIDRAFAAGLARPREVRHGR